MITLLSEDNNVEPITLPFFSMDVSVRDLPQRPSPVSYFDSHSAPRTAPYNKLHKLPIEGFFSQTLAPSWPEVVAPY